MMFFDNFDFIINLITVSIL